MAEVQDPKEQFRLITRNLQEYLNGQIIENVLQNEKRPVKVYWGTAPTGRPHCGYFVPMVKLADLLKAGCEVTVLLADLHAFLDNMKAPLETVQFRAQYYGKIVKAILKSINVPIDKLKFVVGSSYQLSEKYTMDLFRLSNIVSQNDAKRAGADVVKQVANPLLSGLIYPLMQALDEEFLGVDVQFGGVDQRKIFVLAEENLPGLGYKKRAHLMNKMVPGLGQGGKMSASDPNSKIDVLEDPKVVIKKINSAYCAPGDIENNGLIAFIENVILPIQQLRAEKEEGVFKFFIDRPDKYGGPITYTSLDELKDDYKNDKLSPVDLKSGVSSQINALLAPIRAEFDADPEFQEVEAKGYPKEQPKEVKKVKKVKNKGTRYPGGAPAAKENAGADAAAGAIAEKLESTKVSDQ
jgi:tyrosyl-tRNA synthetase